VLKLNCYIQAVVYNINEELDKGQSAQLAAGQQPPRAPASAQAQNVVVSDDEDESTEEESDSNELPLSSSNSSPQIGRGGH
jgi:hypothetical protein